MIRFINSNPYFNDSHDYDYNCNNNIKLYSNNNNNNNNNNDNMYNNIKIYHFETALHRKLTIMMVMRMI